MASQKAQWITLAEYAKTLKVTYQAVQKAITHERIPASAVKRVADARGGKKKVLINKTAADVAWVATENPNSKRTPETKAAVERIKKKLKPSSTRKIPTPIVAKQPEDRHITLSEAQRAERVAKAELLQLDVLERKGALIQKELVYKQLFDAGKQLRDSIMAIPSRVTAEIVAAGGNQLKVRTILTEALATTLENLTDIYSAKLG